MNAASEPAADLIARARRLGPLPYSARGIGPAPALPSPSELAVWQVDAIDGWWDELGRPDPFTLVEIGAGDGTRAAAFLAAGPECLTALRYVLVEPDPWLRERHRTHLPLESPILVLGPVGSGDQDEDEGDDDLGAVEGIGPLITALSELPVVQGPAIVLAVGWASRLPTDRLEWRHGRWWEIRLAAAPAPAPATATAPAPVAAPAPTPIAPPPSSALVGIVELPVPLDEDRSVAADALTGSRPRPDGARYAQLRPAAEWLARALRVGGSGRLAVIDRWTVLTQPLAPGEVPPVALDQLLSIRGPIEAAPVELFPGLSMVSWRLG